MASMASMLDESAMEADAAAFIAENMATAPPEDDDAQTVDTEAFKDFKSTGPVVTLLIGMAGSGKTTLFHRLHYDAQEKGRRCYFINLAPAVLEVPIEPQIDIRDTIDYKGIMTEYRLGPNGAIVTALNLFATQFADVMKILEKRKDEYDHVIVDTPGQIEAFTWSASGMLIAESLASTYATNVVYVVDTPRTSSPATFMSNMVYACSILHKYRLPLTAAFNKCDVSPAAPLFEWMDDFEAFHEALDRHTRDDPGGAGYVTSLHRSMSLVLDEFYKVLERVAASAVDGSGIDELFGRIENSRALYDTTYGREVEAKIAKTRELREKLAAEDMARLRKDMETEGGEGGALAKAEELKKGRGRKGA